VKIIARNAGKESSIIVDKLLSSDENIGYNAKIDRFEDMFKAGVIDPTKVTRTALMNAVSIGGMLLITEAVVTDVPEKKDAPAMPPGGMGGMGGMGGYPGMM
jgi:chaperonin GroEL